MVSRVMAKIIPVSAMPGHRATMRRGWRGLVDTANLQFQTRWLRLAQGLQGLLDGIQKIIPDLVEHKLVRRQQLQPVFGFHRLQGANPGIVLLRVEFSFETLETSVPQRQFGSAPARQARQLRRVPRSRPCLWFIVDPGGS